ncbi:MAG: Holliday junction branch migration DNA helicase RuvB, partial [Planctomycetes bacterium]|nr:Holliday junction branch migration DNA helicase RuvB [Planctomycetota bacterium]
IVAILARLKRGDVLFIDEIHRMSTVAEELLYSAMEDFKVDIVLSGGVDAQSVRVSVEPFTLVGATTREGLLSAPFRSRFGIVEKLEPYPASDILEIIRRSARLLGCTISGDEGLFLAERCRGTPRYANRFLRRVRDLAQCKAAAGGRLERAQGPLELGRGVIEEGLDRLGIDSNGLDRTDRKILEILLESDEPVGVKTIAVSVGEEERTIEDVHEPYLIQRGMLLKTPRGRRPSARAFQLYRPAGRFAF